MLIVSKLKNIAAMEIDHDQAMVTDLLLETIVFHLDLVLEIGFLIHAQ